MTHCGLVLTGGGGRGAYQIGCWLALKELGYAIGSVSGMSVGGLNAALVGIDDRELALGIWLGTTNQHVYRWDVAHWLRGPLDGAASLARHSWDELRSQRLRARPHRPALRALAHTMYRRGFFNTARGLQQIVRHRLDPERLRASASNIWITTMQARGWLPWRGEPIHWNLKQLSAVRMADVLLASSAIPFLFPAVRHGREWLADAGWAAPDPIAPVYRDGERLIFVVHCHPHRRTDASRFTGARIVDICPSAEIGSMLRFSPERSQLNLELGARDVKQLVTTL